MSTYLKPRDWRVLCACLVVTATYSRVEDSTSVGQLANLSGISRSRTSESLGRLDAAGVISWRPTCTAGAKGRSRLSLVAAAPDFGRLTEPGHADEAEVCPF